MNQKTLQRFRTLLEKQLEEVRRSVFQLEQYGRTIEDERAADVLDRAGSSHSILKQAKAEYAKLQ